MEVELAYINRFVGVQLGAAAIADLLSRMALDASASESGATVTVCIPPTRSDILHPCDVVEVGLAPAVSHEPARQTDGAGCSCWTGTSCVC